MSRRYERISVSDAAHFPRPGTVVPAHIGFTPDGSAITYLFSVEGNLQRSLWRYDLATGRRRVIAGPPAAQAFSREEELRRERLRLREVGVTDYHFARKAARETFLVPAPDAIRVSIGGDMREVPNTANVQDARLSPDGTRLAFVREGDLFAVELATGRESRLTHDAEDGLTNGLAEFIAQEELGRDRGFWWSPDGERIAFVRADIRHIPAYPIVHQGSDAVDIEYHRYPFAGAANARVELGVVEVATGTTTWMDIGRDPDIYLARVNWRPDGVLTAQVLSREQRDLALVVFREGRTHLLLHEHGEPWLNLHDDLRFLESGEFLWSSERSGFRHLELRARDGSLVRTLTSGDWVVSYVVGVDERRRLVYFSAGIDTPTERQIFRVSLDTGELKHVTEGAGWHGGELSPDGSLLVEYHSHILHGPRTLLRDLESHSTTVLFANEGATATELGLRAPELITLPAADGMTPLYGVVYCPPEIEPGRRYPVIVSVYGGPHAQRAINEWSQTVDLRAQYLAQEGFLVLKVDNRGSAGRGLAFEAPIARETGTVEVDDQVAAVRWLAENYAIADPERVGIFGWSYGGYATLMCMAKAPDVFKVGVSGAPVTHWDGYDTAYTERYMGTPANNPEGYERSSVMAHIAGLRGKVMLVHGMIDENVHFRHTARLIVALAAAGKEYDLRVFPEERHMPRAPRQLEDEERRITGYFKTHL